MGPRERSFFLSPGEQFIGSLEENDLTLTVSGVSRRHARLLYDEAGLLQLNDLRSRNGTFVNGKAITRTELHPGDKLRFGSVELSLEEIDPGDTELALVLTEADAEASRPFPAEQSTVVLDTVSPAPPPQAARQLVFPQGFLQGRSTAMERFYAAMRPLLGSDLPVLIEGETGVGKEVAARVLHLSSVRSAGPFVAVNCAAIPSDLLEAEMFGIGEGVATGVRKRTGRFREAQGGTLFLDEIGELPLELQAKLLRALQEKEVQPVGSPAVPVDVWVVAATNVDLEQRVQVGSFRRDLYYRVAGFVLTVPPLRDRQDDIPVLVEHFLRAAAKKAGKSILGVTAKAMDVLMAYPWPGNVRELEHEVRRLAHLVEDGQAVESGMLSPRLLKTVRKGGEPVPEAASLRLQDHVAATERQIIGKALERADGSQRQAARLLGVARSTLVRKLRELGLTG